MTNSDTVLVTGGTGFVAMQIILQLLQKGYHVKMTVRSLNSKDKVIETHNKISKTEISGITTIPFFKKTRFCFIIHGLRSGPIYFLKTQCILI